MRTSKTTTRIGWILAMALTSGVGVATAQDVHPLLAKGKVIEEAEHDLDGAAELYAQVAEDGSLGPVVRAEAFLRLAKVRQRQGEYAAARVALQNAAHGEGAAAQEASRLLEAPQEPQEGARSVELQILRLMTELRERRGEQGAADIFLDQIAWFGERAVPLLVEAVEAETDFEMVSLYAQGLMKIGGPKVEAWVEAATKYEDPLRRRAVARGNEAKASRVDARKLAAFLEDPAAEVRLQAVESGVLVDWEQALARLRDEDARVREAASRWFLGRVDERRLPAQDRRGDVCIEVIRELQVQVAEGEQVRAEDVLGQVAGAACTIASPEDRIAVALAVVRARNIRMENYSSFRELGDGLEAPDESNVFVKELCEAARALRGVSHDTGRYALFINARDVAVKTWDRTSREGAFELVELGVGLDVDWFARNLEPADWITLFERLDTFEHLPDYSSSYLTKQLDAAIEVDLPAEAFEPLRRWFEAKAAAPGTDSMWLHRALVRLGKFGTEESAQWSVRMLTGGLAALPATGPSAETLRFYRDGLFQGLIAADTPATVAALRELAVVEGEEHAALRNMALSRLVWLHDVESAPLFARAYELGLERTPMYFAWGAPQPGSYNLIGLGWIEPSPYVTSTSGPQPLPTTEPWTDAEKAQAIGPCLELGTVQPWLDPLQMISKTEPPGAVFEVACRNWSKCPDSDVRESFFKELSGGVEGAPMPLVRELVIDALGDPSAEIRHDAMSRIRSRSSRYDPIPWGDDLAQAVRGCLDFPDDRIVAEALGALGRSGDGAMESVLVEHLAHESHTVRRAAVSALFDLVPDRAIELTFDTLRDPSMRMTMTGVAKQTLDRRFVPLLIDALRDEDDTVRTRAKEALDAIEFYVSQEQRWKRLLSDAGLEANNAAEALIEQARKADDKQVRLLAIRSLGTLAVPETLPFLIQLTQDADPEIAAAATAAVERINK